MTIVIKPTYACNADCIYCYAAKEHRNAKMSNETLEKIFIKISDNIHLIDKSKNIKFLWHGGEPLILGKDFYKHVIELSKTYFKKKKINISHQMQSNLTLLDEEYIGILSDLLDNKKIGTSVDPFDSTRPLKNGKDYLTEWGKAFKLLKKNNFQVGLVYTVHKGSLNKYREIIDWLNTLGDKISCRLNPVFKSLKGGETSGFYISGEEYGDFLINIYKLYRNDTGKINKNINIAPYDDWTRIIRTKGKDKICSFKENCQLSFMGIDYKGNVSGCGRFLASSDIVYGNLLTDDIFSIIEHPSRNLIENRSEALKQQECKDCPHWHLCAGDCPSIAYSYYGDINRKSPFCQGYFKFFEYWRDITKKRKELN